MGTNSVGGATFAPAPTTLPVAPQPTAIDAASGNLQQIWNVGIQFPQVVGVCHGNQWNSVTCTGPPLTTLTMQRFDASAPDGGVVMSYLFQTIVRGGNTIPRYGLVGHTQGEQPSAEGTGTDLGGVSGVASTQNNSDGRARGVYAEANFSSTHPHAYAVGSEVTVRNTTGQPATLYRGNLDRSTAGVFIEAGGNALNGVALAVTAEAGAEWQDGIVVDQGAVVPGGAAFRMQNNRWLASTKADGVHMQPLIGLGGDNTTRIFGDYVIFRSANDGSEICRISAAGGLQFPNGHSYR